MLESQPLLRGEGPFPLVLQASSGSLLAAVKSIFMFSPGLPGGGVNVYVVNLDCI